VFGLVCSGKQYLYHFPEIQPQSILIFESRNIYEHKEKGISPPNYGYFLHEEQVCSKQGNWGSTKLAYRYSTIPSRVLNHYEVGIGDARIYGGSGGETACCLLPAVIVGCEEWKS
jgi:hypothetical protein